MKKKNLRIGGVSVLVVGGAAHIASAQYQTTNFVTSTAPGGSAPSDFVNNVQFGAYGTRSPAIEPVFNTGSVTLAGSGYSDAALALIDSNGTSSGGGAFGMYGNTDALLNFTFLSGTSNGNVQFGMGERIDGAGGNVFGHGSNAPLAPGNYNDYPLYYCNYAGGKLTLMQQGGYAGGALPGTQLAQQTGISLAGGADTYTLEMSTQGGATPTITVTLTQNSTVVGLLTATGSVTGSYYGCSSTPDLQGEVGFYGGSDNWSGTPYGIQATAFSVNQPVTVTWNGNVSGTWDTSTANWQKSALYGNNDIVVFDDTAAGPNFTVDLAGATVTPGSITVNNSLNAYTIGNGTIADGAAGPTTLVKNGTNTLTLTGSNLFSGGTTVNAGSLAVNNTLGSGTGSGNVTIIAGVLGGSGTMVPTGTSGMLISIASGAQLAPSFGTGNGTTTLNANVSSSSSAAAFDIAGGAILNYNFAAPGTSDSLNVTGNVTLEPGTDTLNINQLTGFGAGNYTLISATSLTENAGNWTLPSSTQYVYAVIGNSTALVLDVTPNGPATVVWSGNTSGSWDTTSSNWQSAALYADNDLVVFDDTAGGNFTVDLGGATLKPGLVTINNSNNAYTIGNGTIADSAAGNATTLVKNGSNTLTLTGANTYSGGTTVNAGTLIVTAATNGLLSGSNVTNNALLQFSGSQTLGNLSGTGTTTVNGSLTVTSTLSQASLINNGTLTVNGTGTVATLADISGLGTAGNTTVNGSLTVTSFAQASLLNNGLVEITGNGTIGQLTGTGTLTIGNGSLANTVTLAAAATSGVLGSSTQTQGSITIASGSTLDISNNAVLLNYGNGTSPLAAVANAVTWGAGNVGNASNGAIVSGTVIAANANSSTAGKYAVGYADHTEIASIPTGNVEVAYTLAGDANLDGSVDILDYQQMAPHYDEAGTYDWSQGDFNHDGHVDILDYQAMAPNYDTRLTAGTLTGADSLTASLTASDLAKPLGGAAAVAELPASEPSASSGINVTDITAAVPEPASLSLLLLGGIPLLGRRRRRTVKS